jgi:hypothetical protein
MDYPSSITNLNSQELYDTARWILFNWYGPKKIDDIYYGQMELRYKDVFSRNDTIEIFFQFYSLDTSSLDKSTSRLVARASVAFRLQSKRRLWAFVYPYESWSAGLESGDKLLESPLSDTAINFMRSHRNILNSCYLMLAKKGKVIED